MMNRSIQGDDDDANDGAHTTERAVARRGGGRVELSTVVQQEDHAEPRSGGYRSRGDAETGALLEGPRVVVEVEGGRHRTNYCRIEERARGPGEVAGNGIVAEADLCSTTTTMTAADLSAVDEITAAAAGEEEDEPDEIEGDVEDEDEEHSCRTTATLMSTATVSTAATGEVVGGGIETLTAAAEGTAQPMTKVCRTKPYLVAVYLRLVFHHCKVICL